MVKLVDTHSHIFVDEFENKQQIVQSAIDAGVATILMPNIDVESLPKIKETAGLFPNQTRLMMGLHPSSVDAEYLSALAIIKQELDTLPCCAVGEIGLDYYWSDEFKNQQLDALSIQLQWAIDKNLPVSLHTRSATSETIALCRNYPGLKGVFHCFGGTKEEADQIVSLGMYLGIGGVLTFKNAGLAEVIKDIDLEHLVLETDAPYLAPHPKRGKRNEPALLRIIAEKLAEVKGISLEEVAEKTTVNATKVFNL
jgi:TatD DNase family protein